MNEHTDRLTEFDTASEPASTTKKIAEAAHRAIEESASRAEGVERALRSQAGRAQEKVQASQVAAGEQMEKSLEQIEAFVKERPLTATGIAFAAGLVAAALLRR